MSDDNNRLKAAQWILERSLAWISGAEVKVGVIVAINTAMLAGLGSAYNGALADARIPWAYVFIAAAVLGLSAGLYCAAMAVLPRLDGPAKSLLFFGRVAKVGQADYIEALKKASDDDLLADWSAQIHRNAEIACIKFGWVRTAMVWSFSAIVPWCLAIFMLVKK